MSVDSAVTGYGYEPYKKVVVLEAPSVLTKYAEPAKKLRDMVVAGRSAQGGRGRVSCFVRISRLSRHFVTNFEKGKFSPEVISQRNRWRIARLIWCAITDGVQRAEAMAIAEALYGCSGDLHPEQPHRLYATHDWRHSRKDWPNRSQKRKGVVLARRSRR